MKVLNIFDIKISKICHISFKNIIDFKNYITDFEILLIVNHHYKKKVCC